MFRRVIVAGLLHLLVANAAAEGPPAVRRGDAQLADRAKASSTETLTEAAVIALIIAGSIAAYKALGRPCACPEDTMRNGRRCGGNSAWSRAGGYKPMCYPTDVTASMIAAYRATKAIPPMR
jgi:hypothetical protein